MVAETPRNFHTWVSQKNFPRQKAPIGEFLTRILVHRMWNLHGCRRRFTRSSRFLHGSRRENCLSTVSVGDHSAAANCRGRRDRVGAATTHDRPLHAWSPAAAPLPPGVGGAPWGGRPLAGGGGGSARPLPF